MSGPLSRLARLARTIRHLRPRQAVALLSRNRRRVVAPVVAEPDRLSPQALGALAAFGPVSSAATSNERARAWMDGRVLGLGNDVPWTGDWHEVGPNALWRYHLLYHDHLADVAWLARDAEDPRAIETLDRDLGRWEEQVPAGARPAWDAYPVSVRLANWARILSWCAARLPASRTRALADGIATQVAFLRDSLEWHLDGNHLLRNAWAVALGDQVLGDRAASVHSLATFAEILADQVHPDGWHVERTPMYQARILRDLLELQAACAATGTPLDRRTAERIAAVQAALPWMLRGDGSLWALNDTAVGHEVSLASLLRPESISATAGVKWFRDAGAVVAIDRTTGDRLRFDASGPAPAYQPGHSHAGALGFELDLAGKPFIVDSGCSGYDGDPWREHLRGSAAHSTVTADGLDQSEMWATFRIGGRAIVSDLQVTDGGSHLALHANCRPWHDSGFVHRRELTRRDRTIRCVDRITGARGRRVEGFLHFDPAWELHREGERVISLRQGAASVVVRIEGAVAVTAHRGEREPLLGWRAAGFGRVVPAWSLRLQLDSTGDGRMTTIVEPR